MAIRAVMMLLADAAPPLRNSPFDRRVCPVAVVTLDRAELIGISRPHQTKCINLSPNGSRASIQAVVWVQGQNDHRTDDSHDDARRLTPGTGCIRVIRPKVWNSQPPTTAAMIPRRISPRDAFAPVVDNLLAMNPETSPDDPCDRLGLTRPKSRNPRTASRRSVAVDAGSTGGR